MTREGRGWEAAFNLAPPTAPGRPDTSQGCPMTNGPQRAQRHGEAVHREQLAVRIFEAGRDAIISRGCARSYCARVATKQQTLNTQLLDAYLEDLQSETDRLGELFTAVAPWWIADRPPEFAPTAPSVCEGVLVACVRLLALAIRAPNDQALCLSVAGHAPRLDSECIEVALRCEAAVMAQRQWAGLVFPNTEVTYTAVHHEAELWAGYHAEVTASVAPEPPQSETGRPRHLDRDEMMRRLAELKLQGMTMKKAAPLIRNEFRRELKSSTLESYWKAWNRKKRRDGMG